MGDEKESALIFKPLARGVLQQALRDIKELPPGDPNRESAEKFIKSRQHGYVEARSRWLKIATLEE
jgi:hypothetical protein